jgi:hypothetical protein
VATARVSGTRGASELRFDHALHQLQISVFRRREALRGVFARAAAAGGTRAARALKAAVAPASLRKPRVEAWL